MPSRLPFILIFMLLATFLKPGTALADGIIIPDPPICIDCLQPILPMSQLEIRYHHVQVTIDDQVAVTRVDQVFYNPNAWQVEGVYVFPLPEGAAVSSFSLWIDGKPVQGEVLDAKQARQTYEEIVRSMQDPALLEYADRGAVRASIFPIPPEGERRIELEYSQVLSVENGLVRYIYPLNTEKFSARPLEEVSVSVRVRASIPVRAVYSPSHLIDVVRDGDRRFLVGYEARDVLPDTDFALYYSLGETEAFHLLSYRDPGSSDDPDGFFLLLLAPRPDVSRQALPKDLLLVLDKSGSMEGEKFQQAQEALRFILRHLNPEDRFNIISFSTGLDLYAQNPRPASDANDALVWVDRLSAQGSTDINRALLEAAAQANPERATYLIFLTDGLPTEGETDSQRILDNLSSHAPESLRLFAFGVGYDVDTFLLDSLAQAHHGTSFYVFPGERLDESLSVFYEKISAPVLTDLELDFGTLRVYDLYPSPLPDLFLGSQTILVGRYREGGETDVILRGSVDGVEQIFRFSGQVFTRDSLQREGVLSSLPRLWATRKIGLLLNQMRLKTPDQETIDQIVRLSIRYGIVTPYTSYLITEEMPLGAAEQERIAQDQFGRMLTQAPAPSSGQAAVESAADQGEMLRAESVAAPAEAAAGRVKIAGPRTFVLQDGIWTDTSFDPDRMQPVRLAFLSEDYFNLAEGRPEISAALALGSRVIVVYAGTAYEIVDPNSPSTPVEMQPASTPDAGDPNPAATPPQVPFTTPVDDGEQPSPGMLPCGSGLLPFFLLVVSLVVFYRR